MIYKLGYNLPKAEINKRVMAYDANQIRITQLLEFANAEKARCEASIENLTKDYAKALDQNLQLNEQLRRYKEVLYRGPIGLSTKTRISMIDEANQAEIARLQAEIIQLRGKYNRLCEANSLDDVVWGKTWTEMEKQQTEIARLKAKLELCRESLIECRVCSMMPGEVEKITTEALAAIERRDGE
ncbi:MAG: hypothetical protein WC428_07395 [Candidatus Paceibacterota bacterium]